MQTLPKIKDLKSPDGYFEKLPDQILLKANKKESYPWMKWAASVILIAGLGVWQYSKMDTTSEQLIMEQEIDLYIDSQYWSAEDILSMSDNPEEILNEIIQDENPFIEDASSEQEEIWY
ncbi:hypothetical protein JYB62_06515 [Algoriphagus lutimaris]|uniref:hypothetical protein n=1 Tax=Algoriphagus lutimaris TaxID=613197 RepID=UPI00196B150D|nr:hypothetical protein [Algoriphagus lutimaris]MBN3519653.1 hypothetical protein [Algoriphagus lutimaris]